MLRFRLDHFPLKSKIKNGRQWYVAVETIDKAELAPLYDPMIVVSGPLFNSGATPELIKWLDENVQPFKQYKFPKWMPNKTVKGYSTYRPHQRIVIGGEYIGNVVHIMEFAFHRMEDAVNFMETFNES